MFTQCNGRYRKWFSNILWVIVVIAADKLQKWSISLEKDEKGKFRIIASKH